MYRFRSISGRFRYLARTKFLSSTGRNTPGEPLNGRRYAPQRNPRLRTNRQTNGTLYFGAVCIEARGALQKRLRDKTELQAEKDLRATKNKAQKNKSLKNSVLSSRRTRMLKLTRSANTKNAVTVEDMHYLLQLSLKKTVSEVTNLFAGIICSFLFGSFNMVYHVPSHQFPISHA